MHSLHGSGRQIMENRSPAPAGVVATRNEEELAKIQDGTTVVVRLEGTLSRRTVVARGPVRAGLSGRARMTVNAYAASRMWPRSAEIGQGRGHRSARRSWPGSDPNFDAACPNAAAQVRREGLDIAEEQSLDLEAVKAGPDLGQVGLLRRRHLAATVDPSGDIVLGGVFVPESVVNGKRTFGDFQELLVRYTPGGALDATFGNGGVALTSLSSNSASAVTSLVAEPDGDILAIGWANASSYNETGSVITVARYLGS